MDRRRLVIACFVIGVLLVSGPLYLGAVVPDRVFVYDTRPIDPNDPVRVEDAFQVGALGEDRFSSVSSTVEGKALEEAAENGTYTIPMEDAGRALRGLPNDRYVSWDGNADIEANLSFFRVENRSDEDTFRLAATRISSRQVIAEDSVRLENASPGIQRVVEEGRLETTDRIQPAVVDTGDGYVTVWQDTSREYTGPLRVLPPAFVVVGVGFIGISAYLFRELEVE
jgi:hypothetical protein